MTPGSTRAYWSLFIVFLVFLIIGLLFSSSTDNLTSRERNWIQILTRQTARWTLAAQQDKSPVIALLHANYAAGYLWALKDIASTEIIEHVANIDVEKLTSEVVKTQDWATKQVVNLCKIETENPYLAKIAGEA